MNTQVVDMTIVGGGMTGLALACAMSGAGLRILVADAGEQPGKTENQQAPAQSFLDSCRFDSGLAPRVSSLNLAAEKLLEKIGAWQYLDQNRLGIFSHMRVWDGEGTAEIDFDCGSIQQDHLGHVIENSNILQALLRRVEKLDDISYASHRRLESIDSQITDCPGGGMELRFDDGSSVRTTLLVGADGGKSAVRKLLEFATREWSYDQTALVTTVETDQSHQFTAWQCFTNQGPLAFLPTANENLCSIVWSVDPAFCKQLLYLSEKEFCDRVGRAFEHRIGTVTRSDRRYSFALRQCHAKTYIKPGVVLVGDAAHTIHPLAGQGVNLGFRDVDVLGQELRRAITRGVNFNTLEILARYERRCMGDNLAMMAAMEGFQHLYKRSAPGINWVRNTGMKLFDRNPFIKQSAIKIASGLW